MSAIRDLDHWPYLELVRNAPPRTQPEQKSENARSERNCLLTAGIAHDFNNLLTVIAGNLSVLAQAMGENEAWLETLQEAEEAARRAAHLSRRLLSLARNSAPVKELADLPELVRRTARFVLRGSDVAVMLKSAEDIWPVEIDSAQIGQVLDNLLINAREAMNGQGTVTLELKNVTLTRKRRSCLPSGRYVQLRVIDQGPGVPDLLIDRIFDPYFTTKASGSGLGLATSYAVIRQHEGLLEVEKGLPRGACFTITLPVAEKAAPAKPSPSPPASLKPSGAGGIVLVVDDEIFVRQSLRKMLARIGYEVAEASSSHEALTWCREHHRNGGTLSAIILDLTLPDLLGPETLVRDVQAYYPGLPVLICSGYAGNPILLAPRRYGFAEALPKPFGLQELKEKMNILSAAASKVN